MTGSRSEGTGYWYCIRVHGVLNAKWADWFGGMNMQIGGDETILRGPVADQAALHGILAKIRDLGLVLLAVQREEACSGTGSPELEV